MKKLFLSVAAAILSLPAVADEGMWLLPLLKQQKLAEMQALGLKLQDYDVYSPDSASLKDAVVIFGGGCTGEVVSPDGLILTNHHCGYGSIQDHSTLEHDYLTDGFWATSREMELPNPGLSVTFIDKINDVTDYVKAELEKDTDPNSMNFLSPKYLNGLAKAKVGEKFLQDNDGTEVEIKAFYGGNVYYMFTKKKYKDVRLVGAPPSAIGKFGADTDNWMWPRHTGDFTVFRIYADKNNKAAAYSKDNVPYTPKRSLTISIKPIQAGDFTFIYGFPGVTKEYLHSAAVKQIVDINNVHNIALRTQRLDIIDAYMKKDPAVRIQYSAKQANIANAWKRWQGESRGVKKLGAIEKKKELENTFEAWAADKPAYTFTVKELQTRYDELEKFSLTRDYYREGIQGIEVFKFIAPFVDVTPENLSKKLTYYRDNKDKFFKDYYKPIDVETAKKMLNAYYENVPSEFHTVPLTHNNWKIDTWVEQMFESSVFTSQEKLDKLFKEPHLVILDAIHTDPLFVVYKGFADVYNTQVEPNFSRITADITSKYKVYMKGLMEMQQDKIFYPDANSTLRIAYGNVRGFEPSDGVIYTHGTTLDGVIAKDNPEIYDYKVDAKLKELHKNKEYGRWGDNGVMPVCFLATNHTTGGNSGSPVLNGNGELIGLNFDRCWESTMSDIVYSDTMCRNIAVDIRYVLFIVDKVCGAGYLIDEMKIKN